MNLPDVDAAFIETYELDLTRYAKMALEKGLHVQMDKPGGFMRRQVVVTGTKGTYEIKPLEFYEPGMTDDFLFSQKCETYVNEEGLAPWGDYHPFEKSEMFNRYDGMFKSFASIIRGEIENPYPYEYEKKLYRVVLNACGANVDYK